MRNLDGLHAFFTLNFIILFIVLLSRTILKTSEVLVVGVRLSLGIELAVEGSNHLDIIGTLAGALLFDALPVGSDHAGLDRRQLGNLDEVAHYFIVSEPIQSFNLTLRL